MIILASKSPRRRMLLSEAGISFRCIPADIIEKTSCIRPSFRVRDLARQKAEAVAELNPEMPVLGSDTLVYCKGESVYTGVAVVWKKKKLILSATAVSHCKARKLPEEELEKIARKHLDKAGAYAVQDKDDQFIEKTEGSFDTIVGLPVFLVKELLTKAGIKEDGSYE